MRCPLTVGAPLRIPSFHINNSFASTIPKSETSNSKSLISSLTPVTLDMATSPPSSYSQASPGFKLNPSLAQPDSLLVRRNTSLMRRNASQRVPLFNDEMKEHGRLNRECLRYKRPRQGYSPVRWNPFTEEVETVIN